MFFALSTFHTRLECIKINAQRESFLKKDAMFCIVGFMADIRRQRSEIGRHEPEVGGQKSDVGKRKSDVGCRMSDIGF